MYTYTQLLQKTHMESEIEDVWKYFESHIISAVKKYQLKASSATLPLWTRDSFEELLKDAICDENISVVCRIKSIVIIIFNFDSE